MGVSHGIKVLKFGFYAKKVKMVGLSKKKINGGCKREVSCQPYFYTNFRLWVVVSGWL